MAGMDFTKLAEDMKKAAGSGAFPLADPNKGMAKAIVEELQQLSVVSFAPGGITGKAPSSGGKLSSGAGSGGIIVGPKPDTLAARMAKEMGVGSATPELLKFAAGIATHYLTGKVVFAVGKITGKCTNTSSSPGALAGEGSGGKITGLSGPAMTALCAAAFGGQTSPELTAVCAAIVDHIMTFAEVSFKTATIVGACSSGGGPVAAGAGTAGKVA